MNTAATIASELRAHFLDCMTYLVPGGVFLLLAIESTEHFLHTAIFLRLARFWLSSASGAWRPGMTVVVLLGLSYVAGVLLRIVDDEVPFPPLRVPGGAGDPTRMAMTALQNRLTDWDAPSLRSISWWPARWLVKTWPSRHIYGRWQRRMLAVDSCESLYGVAEPVVLETRAATEAWVERYAALGNLCGGMAWAIALGALIYWLSLRGLDDRLPAYHVAPSLGLVVTVVTLFLLLKIGQEDYDLRAKRLAMSSAAEARALRAPQEPAPAAEAQAEE